MKLAPYHLLLSHSDLYKIDELLTLVVPDMETLRGPAGMLHPWLILGVPVTKPCTTQKTPHTVRLTYKNLKFIIISKL